MKVVKVFAVSGGAVGLLALAAPAASASEAGSETTGVREPGTQSVAVADRSELMSAAKPAERTSGEARRRIDEFVRNEALAARPVDIRELQYIEVQLDDGATAGAVVFDHDVVDEVVAVSGEANEVGQNHFLGAKVVPVGQSVTGGVSSAGYDQASSGNATRQDFACRSLWWDSVHTVNDHYVYDCWEKWKSNTNYRDWAYNRYTLFDAANPDSFAERIEIVDATIRSRPWAGYGWKIDAGPYNYQPNPTSSCSQTGVGVGMGSASISVPFMTCNAAISVLPNASQRSYGVDWNGRTTAQVKLDAAWAFIADADTNANDKPPLYADYVWMETSRCLSFIGCNGTAPSEYMVWTDSGW